MRHLALALLLGIALLAPPAPLAHGLWRSQQGAACGVERWPVKVLGDGDAASVDTVGLIAETVADLVHIPAPATLPERHRVAPVELTVYSVTARLVEAKLEPDSDIHLIIADPQTGDTMIVELPDADRCALTTDPSLVAEMDGARNTFIAQFGLPPGDRFLGLGGIANVTGVGFFDLIHGQRGVAPNGIELHPVLDLAITPSSVKPAAAGPTPPVRATPAPPAPSAVSAPGLAALAPSSSVSIVSVSGGQIGSTATVAAQVPKGASCTISYLTPSGTQSAAAGLVPSVADSSGQVSWTWNIGSSTRPGTGTVSVSCSPGGPVTTAITIG